MMKLNVYAWILLVAIVSTVGAGCGAEQENKAKRMAAKPVVADSGQTIRFPMDSTTLQFFKTALIAKENLNAALTAPGHVAAAVTGGSSQSLVLFEDPDLSASYTAMLQNLVNIRQKANIIQQKNAIIQQKKIELDRFKDLAEHGAGTGKDVADAQTDLITAQTDLAVAQNELANEKTAILEPEAKLKLAGFNPQALLRAPAGKVWVICDIPENQVTSIKEGGNCTLQFNAYPGEIFKGVIEDIADVIDITTRLVKLRISISNPASKLRAGMFSIVSFGVTEGSGTLSIPKNSVVTVQGQNFVFVKKNDSVFNRKQIITGPQVNERIIVYGGLQEGDAVVTDGAMQLKGLSFGY